MQLQVTVGAPDGTGQRPFAVYSRPEDTGTDAPDETAEWVRHAAGALGRDAAPAPGSELSAWPPPGAEPVEVPGLYERLAEHGYRYGPVFQGLTAAWRHGDDLYAEVRLGGSADDTPPAQPAGGGPSFGLHPAVLDAALHVSGLAALADGREDEPVRLPFSWTDVALHATGASTVRVRVTRTGGDTVSLLLADETGAPVATVGSLLMRPVPAGMLSAPARRAA